VRLAHHEWASSGTDAGAAAPVAVLVHGILGWWRTWWRVAPALASHGWRVVALDQRGHGGSPPIGGVANVDDLAGDVVATLAELGIQRVDVLIGHSLGAAVSMEVAYRHPALVRRAVLEDPPGQTRADDVEFQANLEREVRAARADPEAEVRRELAENPAWLEEDARQNVTGRAGYDLDGILASLRSDTGVRPVDLAPLLRLPALYLVADAERSALGARRGELIAAAPSTATVVELDSGHTIHRDRFDEYRDTILQWLERTR
jgi:pimeloyl-ACP methyl ester carboxylesterase